MVLCSGEPPGSFCNIGCCWFSFIVVLHSLLFLHFRATYSMPPALCPGFSGSWRSQPALSVTLATFDCFCFCYGFEWAFFTHSHFYLILLPHICWYNLLLSRLPWEPVVLPWSLQDIMLILETQIRPICLSDSHQSTTLIFERIRF